MANQLNVGVVGATGMVGEVFLELLAERNFPVKTLKLFASDRSRGQTRTFQGRAIEIETLTPNGFDGLDLVFFSSGDDISKEWGPIAVKAGAFAVDNSAAYRMDPNTLLCVPEVNGHLLPKRTQPALIANPNCSTIQLVVALAPLHQTYGLESVIVSTYQAVSGAGRVGQDELAAQTRAWSADQPAPQPEAFPHPIAMNCVPQIGGFNAQGFCSEEMKIMRETKKILGDSSFRVSAFTVRIPAWNAHSEAAWIQLKKDASLEDIEACLARQPGLEMKKDGYPLAREADGKNPVFVGRIHADLENPRTWLMWIVADNLRKGAALNGIQIAERIFDIQHTP